MTLPPSTKRTLRPADHSSLCFTTSRHTSSQLLLNNHQRRPANVVAARTFSQETLRYLSRFRNLRDTRDVPIAVTGLDWIDVDFAFLGDMSGAEALCVVRSTSVFCTGVMFQESHWTLVLRAWSGDEESLLNILGWELGC